MRPSALDVDSGKFLDPLNEEWESMESMLLEQLVEHVRALNEWSKTHAVR